MNHSDLRTGDSGAATVHAAPAVAARRATRATTGLILVSVFAQALIGGGLLAGRSGIGDLHQPVGHMLVVVGFLPLIVGLIGRRKHREPMRILAMRAGLGVLVLATMFAGDLTAGGTRDLLMAHIPLAVLVVAVGGHLLHTTRLARTR